MKKRAFKVVVIAICAISVLSCFGCNVPGIQEAAELEQEREEAKQELAESEQRITGLEAATEPETITELNQTYEGALLDITATDIRAIQDSYSDNDKLIVGVEFHIENTSDKNVWFDSTDIDAYINDIFTRQQRQTVFGESLLGGDIASGKSMVGFYCVSAPTDTTSIELYIGIDRTQIVFILDIPPVEKIDS